MTVALTEQTKRIQLIDRVDNTFAKINIIQNDIHDFLSLPPTSHLNAVPIAENWRKNQQGPHTSSWTGHIQRRVNHLCQWVCESESLYTTLGAPPQASTAGAGWLANRVNKTC